MGSKLLIKNIGFWLAILICFKPKIFLCSNEDTKSNYWWKNLRVTGENNPGFTIMDPNDTGINFENKLPLEKSLSNQVYLNGSGVALGDVNNDGLCDIYLCSLDGANHLYLNLGGWVFKEAAKEYGIECLGDDSTGASFADLDGDGDLDLIVNGVNSATKLFRNDGNNFNQTPLHNDKYAIPGGTTIALADIDSNGLLDIYVTHYRDSTLMDMPNTEFKFRNLDGRKEIYSVNGIVVKGSKFENRFRINSKGGIEENGLPDLVYYNTGDLNFVKTVVNGERFQDSRGIPLKRPLYEWGLAAMFRDINRDGRPDLYVCNDFDTEDRLWLNVGNGRFREAPSYSLRKSSMFSMGVDFADINRDSLDDFAILDMLNRDRMVRKNQMPPRLTYQATPGKYLDRPQYMRNTLFLNRGANVFSEIAFLSGVEASDWSWCPIFFDVDLDGYEDLLITNGVERNARHLDTIIQLKKQRESNKMSNRDILLARKVFPSQSTSNVVFRNLGNLNFLDNSIDWGFNLKGITHGMACGDLDGDGDLDLVANNLNSRASIYRNETTEPRLMVKLKGPKKNSHGIGARIEVVHNQFTQSQEMIGGGRYLSSDDYSRVFAMSKGNAKLTVTWPDLTRSIINVKPNRVYSIDYQDDRSEKSGKKTMQLPMFSLLRAEGVTPHKENLKESTQPLLPRGLYEAGPGIACGDLDKDGWDDLAISNGRGGAVSLYRNLKGRGLGSFKDTISSINSRDGLSLLISEGHLIQCFSNLEDGLAFGDMVTVNKLGKDIVQRIKAVAESAGHMSMADVDCDGDLDLFIAGRSIANHYPKPVDCWVYINENGKFVQNDSWSKAFKKIGVATSAVFAPINSDSKPDLILACEWGSPKVFINTGVSFKEETKPYGLDKYTGLWIGVDVGDFNADGLVDFVMTNRGLNSSYKASNERPLVIYHGDINDDGVWDIIETEYGEGNTLYPRRNASTFAEAMPWITERFNNYADYSTMNISELFGSSLLDEMNRLEVTKLESTVFLQKNNRFIPKNLPIEAQFSSAFSPVVADFDNDGAQDIAISQNQFNLNLEESRDDAGLGVILIGAGNGEFNSLGIAESGFVIPGEGRAAAVMDFNHDGLMDIIVSQNGNLPRLFKNQNKRRGLRVTLKSTEGNINGVGASMRLLYKDEPTHIGAKHIVRMGSGYLSQNTTTQIIGDSETAVGLIVTWPNGNEEGSDSELFTFDSRQLEVIAEKGKGVRWAKPNEVH